MSKWTRAGVRHKTPKWYWVRFGCDDNPSPAQLCTGCELDSYVNGHYLNWSALVEQGIERLSEPIKEPQ